MFFNDGSADFIGRWLQDSAATVICQTQRLCEGFQFTFLDHGPRPQRLHALWSFQGPVPQAIEAWKQAGFSVSIPDRAWNRNHPASVHLRNRGARFTGADSSHVTIPVDQDGNETRGAKSMSASSIRLPASASASCYIILNAPIDGLHLYIVPANGKEQKARIFRR